MNRILLFTAFTTLLSACCLAPVKKDRAAELVSQMTIEEKVSLIAGDHENPFFTEGISRLVFLQLRLLTAHRVSVATQRALFILQE